MPTFRTINACVNVCGASLPEYRVEVNEVEKEVTCWIPSEVGKNFSVSWLTPDLSIDTEGSLFLDGRSVGGILNRKYSPERSQFFTCEYISPTTYREFSFAPIKYTDEDQYLGMPTQDVGNIQLTIWRTEINEVNERFTSKNEDVSDVTLHERSKKLGAHCVHFGDIQNVTTPIKFYKTNKAELLARFIFRYRPIDMLRANGIAPPLPRQEPVKPAKKEGGKRKDTSEVIDIKDDSDEDVEARVVRLKKELKNLESRRVKKRKVKVENRESTLVDNEVIDLT